MGKEDPDEATFEWKDLGDIQEGRPNLGLTAPVLAYRLLQYTLREVLISEMGADRANDIFVKSGRLAGAQFCRNLLNCGLDFSEFVAQLQRVLKEQAIGILRIEKADLKNMCFTLTVAEDLDCSGLPFTDEVLCHYDEGFISGIFEEYTGKPFSVHEIDCWASGDRVCRFDAREVRADG